MPVYRCPKHESVFETTTDSRLPGAGAKDNLPAHPVNGHPDCPQCRLAASEPAATSTGRKVIG